MFNSNSDNRMNVARSARWPPTFGPSDQPEPIDPPIGSYSDYIHHHHLLLLGPKADTQFTIPRRVEG